MSDTSLSSVLAKALDQGVGARSVVTYDLPDAYFADFKQQMRLVTLRWRWAVGVVGLLTAVASELSLAIILVGIYAVSEWLYLHSKRADFVLGDLLSGDPERRGRDKNLLLCFDLGAVVYYERFSARIAIVPAELIETAQTGRSGYRNPTYNLTLWLKGKEYPLTFLDSHVTGGMVNRIRLMNPAIPKSKWWEH
ncbi:hypothetical protein [Pseudomonas serbica]|uniref:hypothetical protein n=1 Tax=Pseudomonas serbica TaxID=2965074 RepID=UPI00237C472D|nr:hypothetical protein [Pseudomonas serbica]